MVVLKSRLYTTGKIVFDRSLGRNVYTYAPDGYLYSGGVRLFKYSEKNLPKYFTQVYCYRCDGYMNAKDVKYLLYVPSYSTNHEYKDDMLYISYKNPITLDKKLYEGRTLPELDLTSGIAKKGWRWYTNHDYIISGPTIVTFTEAVKQYNPSFTNIDNILFEMYLKPIIVGVKNGKEAIRLR